MTAAGTYRLDSSAADGPDEMGREIAGGPAAVDATLVEAAAARQEVAHLLQAAGRVILVGTGMSLAVAHAAAPAWRRRIRALDPGVPLLVREATAAALGDADGESWQAADLVVAISKSGTSPETIAAGRRAARAGATVVAVTAYPMSPLASAARFAIVTPIGEESGAGTKSGLAALAALFAIVGELETNAEARAALRARLEAAVADWETARSAGATLAAAEHTWVAGLGTGLGLAHAAAIMWHEKAHRPAVALSVSELRHGPIEALRRGDAVLVVDTDPPEPLRASYLARLRSELDDLGATTVWVTGDERGGAALALGTLVRLQQLARATALASGAYHDGFAVLREVVKPVENL